MRALVLVLMWVTPAVLAAILGWKGISGYGSAFTEYLVPLPLAGGMLHIPSFLLAATVILSTRNLPTSICRYLPVLAFAVLLVALSLQLDFERIYSWLLTDYEPAGSAFRFDNNPLYLFIASDAFWVYCYVQLRGYRSPMRYWSALPLVPVIVLGLQVAIHQVAGPRFKIGGAVPYKNRGNEIHLIYTSAKYDEKAFLQWIESKRSLSMPWMNSNTEHVAMVFTNSMQTIRWGKTDQLAAASTVATVCLYEEDRSIIPHKGYFDCFAGHETVEEKVQALVASETTGLGKDIDYWYAYARLCAGVTVPAQYNRDIALLSICSGVRHAQSRSVEKFVQKYGDDSEQLLFVRARSKSLGLE